MTARPKAAARLEVERPVETLLPIDLDGREVTLVARAYQGKDAITQAMALMHPVRETASGEPATVRVHSGCVTGDVFHSLRCDCHAQLQAALQRIAATPGSVLIYLPYHEGRGIGLFNKLRAYALQDKGLDTVDANLELGHPVDARDYALAGEILSDLGLRRIRLMTNNPRKISELEAAGVEVVEQIPLRVAPSPHNKRYLATKKERLKHKL